MCRTKTDVIFKLHLWKSIEVHLFSAPISNLDRAVDWRFTTALLTVRAEIRKKSWNLTWNQNIVFTWNQNIAFLRESTWREKHFGCLILIFISLFYRHYFFIFKALFLSHFPLLCQKIAKGEQLLQGGDLKLTYLLRLWL